jgi:uncharacterized protein YfaP (DUF2135 family)
MKTTLKDTAKPHVLPYATAAACVLFACLAHSAEINLQTPHGGWRNSAFREESNGEITRSYPRPPVDRGGQINRTLIEGVLPQNGPTRKSGQLIVNGIAMPLYTDPQGRFAKPWSFGPGSNNVEVRSQGAATKRLQFFENHAGKTRSKLRVVLSWDDAYAEVDMHVISPDGAHAFWARPLLPKGGGLDVDSVDGGGPEIFSTATPLQGTYLLYVNYWGNFNAAGYNFDSQAHEKSMITTRFTIVTNENTPDERLETVSVPLRRLGELTFVRALRVGAAQ